MLVMRLLTAPLCAVAVIALAAPAVAAPAPGSRCTRAGMIFHDDAANRDLKCTKSKGSLVWVNLGNVAGNSPGGGGLQSSAAIPRVIKNWGLDLAPYDPATGMAGVMRIKGAEPPRFDGSPDSDVTNDAYSRIVDLYGSTMKSKPGVQSPQMAFMAPLGTPVISMVDGVVCDLPKLYSGDFSVRVSPTGTKCLGPGRGADVLFEHEHVINPTVKVGDKVKAGQVIATVSDYNPYWKAKGFGMVEPGVFFGKKDGTNPWHACVANYLAPSSKAALTGVLRSIEEAWNAERSDPTLYDLAAQNPLGCLTKQDIRG
jgi:hypothetical protein